MNSLSNRQFNGYCHHPLVFSVILVLAIVSVTGYDSAEKFITKQVMAPRFEDSLCGIVMKNYNASQTLGGQILSQFNVSIPDGTYQTVSSNYEGIQLVILRALIGVFTVSAFKVIIS